MAARYAYAVAALALSASALLCAPSSAAESPCRGPAPAVGEVVEGAVIHVLDAHRLCVASSPDPASWTELELAAPLSSPSLSPDPALSKARLMGAAFSRQARCTVKAAKGGRP